MDMNIGTVVALIKAMCGGADPAVIEAKVEEWLDAHPEATTTVQDGSITEQKLATSIAQKLGLISSLSDDIGDSKNTFNDYVVGAELTASGLSDNEMYYIYGHFFKGQTITVANNTSANITINIGEKGGSAHTITNSLAANGVYTFTVAYNECDRLGGYCAGHGSVTAVVDSPVDMLNKAEARLNSTIATVQAEIPKLAPKEVYANKGLIPNNGVLYDATGYTSFMFYVHGLSKITITPNFVNGSYGYAFFNDVGTFISSSGDVYRSPVDVAIDITVPASAYYVKLSSKDSATKAVTIDSDWGAVIVTKDETAALQKDFDEVAESTTMKVSMNATWSQMNTAGNTGYINTSGNIVSYANQYVSDFVKIDPTQNVAYNVAYIYGSTVAIAFYNKDKQYISGVTAQSGTGGSYIGITGTATPPSGTVFMRYSMSKNTQGGITKTDQYVNYTGIKTIKTAVEELMSSGGTNPWIDKKWCAFGTSITDTSYINQETGEPTGKYVPFLAQYSGLQVTNRGIAGGTIGSGGIHGGSSSILNAILNSNDLDTFDVITLEGFVNDFAAAVSIGEIGDTENTTMYGALHQAISYMLQHSHAEIILITETTGKVYTPSGGTQVSYNILQKNSLDLYQQDYNDVIIRIGQFYGVHVIDAGGKSQINQYHPEYIIDQIHHTTLGGEQYAKTIWEELKNITPAKVSNE